MIEQRSSNTGPLSWADFKKLFQEKYYPKSYCDEKRKEFFSLVQGHMSVAEYEKKFTELAKYALAIVAEEADKCKRFEEGLRGEIRTLVIASTEWINFTKLVEAAMRVEKSLTEGKTDKSGSKAGQPLSASREQTHRDEGRQFAPGVSGGGKFKAKSSGGSYHHTGGFQSGGIQKGSGRSPSMSMPTDDTQYDS